jgi:hypothetical protein
MEFAQYHTKVQEHYGGENFTVWNNACLKIGKALITQGFSFGITNGKECKF